MASTFLTGEWRKLVMVNYSIDPQLLKPFIPFGTTINFWKNNCYVTLAGFMFCNIRAKHIMIPFNTSTEKINLRFYVLPLQAAQQERGVVFIKEIVSKPILAWGANLFYKERYSVMPVKHRWGKIEGKQHVLYRWKYHQWNTLKLSTYLHPIDLIPETEEEFICLQPRGYTKVNETKTYRYEVLHPSWQIYPVTNYDLNVDFKGLYGDAFAFLKYQKPSSVILAEGSKVSIKMREDLLYSAIY
jgi:uncharacterized protein YqjF (DUF2071 family)